MAMQLLAVGSSSPEILLSLVEALLSLGKPAGEIGPSCIIGSGSYNLFGIIAICTISLPYGAHFGLMVGFMNCYYSLQPAGRSASNVAVRMTDAGVLRQQSIKLSSSSCSSCSSVKACHSQCDLRVVPLAHLTPPGVMLLLPQLQVCLRNKNTPTTTTAASLLPCCCSHDCRHVQENRAHQGVLVDHHLVPVGAHLAVARVQ